MTVGICWILGVSSVQKVLEKVFHGGRTVFRLIVPWWCIFFGRTPFTVSGGNALVEFALAIAETYNAFVVFVAICVSAIFTHVAGDV